MIDLHSHILPGLDDGPATLEECVAMVRLAAQTGTTDMVATPHASLDFRFDSELVDQKIAELAAACGPQPRLYRGCDFHLTYDNIQDALAHPATYAINRRNYLLVEFSDLLIAKSTEEIFLRMRQAGLIPVVTHPERNWLLHKRLQQLEAWVAGGCCLQVTAQSLLGRFGHEARDFAWELLRRNLAQFVASDAHDPEDRTPRLDLAYQQVAKKLGEQRAERLLVSNPQAALEGRLLEWEAEPEPPPPRKWRHFWR
jgi:protein-tyrosine phosphatase